MGSDSRGHADHHDSAMTWSGIAAFSSVAAVMVVIVVIVAAIKFQRSRTARKVDPRSLATRARLFSRDRLDTTEYMNNLATLDRKLAMDEILEKRRRVIFTPAVSCELRGGPDDVFVDVIGPIDLVDDHRSLRKSEPWTMN